MFEYARRAMGLKPSAVREILKVAGKADVISLAGGLPAPELFPVGELGEIARRAASEAGALQYSVTEGLPGLREWVSGHLREVAGVECPAERVLITTGSQQGMDLVSKVLVDPGDVVVAEDPAFLGALQVFRSYEARVIGVGMDEEGMCVEGLRGVLERYASARVGGYTHRSPRHDGQERPSHREDGEQACPFHHGSGRVKFVYVTPSFQNPTGRSWTLERRREVAGVAREFGVVILEDDPYGRLGYEGEEKAAVAAVYPEGTIYMGSSSKILAPGLRLGWVAVPEGEMFEKMVVAKQGTDLHTPSLNQRLLEEYVRGEGRLAGHLKVLRAAYASRRDAMLAALEREMPGGSEWTRPGGGMFLWVRVPGVDTEEVFARATGMGVAYVPGRAFWVEGEVRETLRLNFSNASEERIEEGVRRLGRLFKSVMTE